MIVFYDENGKIKAVCEFIPFNKQGIIDKDGTIVHIHHLEIDSDYRNNGVLKAMFKAIKEAVPNTEQAIWERHQKYPGRGYKSFNIKRLIRRLGG